MDGRHPAADPAHDGLAAPLGEIDRRDVAISSVLRLGWILTASAFGIRTTRVARCVAGSGYLMPSTRLTPASVVFSGRLAGVALGFGLVVAARPDLQLAEDIGPVFAADPERGVAGFETHFGDARR